MGKKDELSKANQREREAIAERLLKEGTTKEKAIFICLEYFEKSNRPDETAQAVVDSVSTDERKELVRWIYCYDILTYMVPYFGLGYAEFRAQANEAVSVLLQMEQYSITEQLLNSLYYRLDSFKDEGGKTKRKIDNILKQATTEGVKVTQTDDGQFKLVPVKLQGRLQSVLRGCRQSLSYFKAVIETLEEWANKNKCYDIMPPIMRLTIDEVKTGKAIEMGKYTRQQLLERESRGEDVTEQERSLAVIPSYDEVAANKEYKKLAAAKLKSNERAINIEAYYRDLLDRIK